MLHRINLHQLGDCNLQKRKYIHKPLVTSLYHWALPDPPPILLKHMDYMRWWVRFRGMHIRHDCLNFFKLCQWQHSSSFHFKCLPSFLLSLGGLDVIWEILSAYAFSGFCSSICTWLLLDSPSVVISETQ